MYILFDVGATKTRIAATKDRETFTEPSIVKTPESFDEFKELFVSTAREHTGGEEIELAVGGMTGSLDRERGVMVYSPHLPDWVGREICTELGSELDTTVNVRNDTEIVGLGEVVYGAGRGYGIAGYITVSTGVGGSRFIGGKIDANAYGFEPGHHIIDVTGTAHDGHSDGTLEGLVSGTALEKRHGVSPKEIHDPEVWTTLADELAIGLYNIALLWSPEVIVLGGSMITGDPCIVTETVQEPFQKRIEKVFAKAPDIREAELGDINGVWGALAHLNTII